VWKEVPLLSYTHPVQWKARFLCTVCVV